VTGTDQAAPGDGGPNGTGGPNGAGVDALYQAFLDRAAQLPTGSVGAAEMLLDEFVNSPLPPSTFKSLAEAIAKATGLDKDALRRKMASARAALEGAAAGHAFSAAFAVDPEPTIMPPITVADLLDQIVKVVHARVYCPTELADGVALWALGTWGLAPPSDPDKGPDLFPYLGFTAPAKRCGKTTALETVQHLVRRPLAAADISQAAIYRTIEKYRPTLLLDEFDQLIAKDRDLKGIINSAHTRNGAVIRTVEVQTGGLKTYEPMAFSTFTPLALAGIGSLPPTIADRAVRVRLQRQPPGRNRKRVARRTLQAIRDQLGPHCMAHADALGAAMLAGVADNVIPHSLNDRDADNWRPLLAIAARAGGTWPARAYRAATVLCADGGADSDFDSEWKFGQIVDGITAKRRETCEEYLDWRRQGRVARKPVGRLKGAAQRPRPCRFVGSIWLAIWLLEKDDSGFGHLPNVETVKLHVARVLRPLGIRPALRRINGDPLRGYDVPPIRGAWRQYQP
jgi:hypothetical protein